MTQIFFSFFDHTIRFLKELLGYLSNIHKHFDEISNMKPDDVKLPEIWSNLFINKDILFMFLHRHDIRGTFARKNQNLFDAYKDNKMLTIDFFIDLEKRFNLLKRGNRETINELKTYLGRLIIDYEKMLDNITRLSNNFTTNFESIMEKNSIINEVGLQITFKNDVSIKTLVDLSEASNDWQNLLKNINRISLEPNEDARLLKVEQGSLIISFSAGAISVGIVYKITKRILDKYDKVSKIKKYRDLNKELGIPNEIIEGINNFKDSVIKDLSEDISNEIIKEYNKNIENLPDKEEIKNAVKVTVRAISQFIDKGGEIELISPYSNKELKENQKYLEKKFDEIRHLQDSGIKYLTEGHNEI